MAASFTSNLLTKFFAPSFCCLQVRNSVLLPKRKPVKTFANEGEYKHYLKKRIKSKKEKNVFKKIEVQLTEEEKKALSLPGQSFKRDLPESLLKLKYKKLRDVPGNVLNRMITDVDASTERPNRHLCLLTYPSLINEALQRDFVKNIYFNRLHKLQEFSTDHLEKVRLTHVPDRLLKFLPDNCKNGIFAISSVQEVQSRRRLLNERRKLDRQNRLQLLPMTIICEGISDDVEIGRVLKYAEAHGCEQVFVMDSCADVWKKSVLEAADGAHFKIPILSNNSWDTMSKLTFGDNLYIAHHGTNVGTTMSLKDFVTKKELNKYGRSTRIMKMLEAESSHGTLSKSEEYEFEISSRSCESVNLLTSSAMIIGSIKLDAFSFACNMKFKNCFALTASDDISISLSEHFQSILNEANHQRQTKQKSK